MEVEAEHADVDGDYLDAVAADPAGNVYATGSFTDRVDFDPLDGNYLLSAGAGEPAEAFALKLTADGGFGWAVQLGDQPGAAASGTGIAVDDAGRVRSLAARALTSTLTDPAQAVGEWVMQTGEVFAAGPPAVPLLGKGGAVEVE